MAHSNTSLFFWNVLRDPLLYQTKRVQEPSRSHVNKPYDFIKHDSVIPTAEPDPDPVSAFVAALIKAGGRP